MIHQRSWRLQSEAGVYLSGAPAKLQCFYDIYYSVCVPCICSVIVGRQVTNELNYGLVSYFDK